MTDAEPWTPSDRTDGPLDDVLALVRYWFPAATVIRLVGTHASDDDNVFWVRLGSTQVQIDTGDGGLPPFVVEGDEEGSRLETSTIESASSHVRALLAGAV